MTREQLLIKIEQIKDKLTKYEVMLDKITPHRPIIQGVHNKEYFCGYCGEQLIKGTKKHKCGYLVDWNGIVEKEEE